MTTAPVAPVYPLVSNLTGQEIVELFGDDLSPTNEFTTTSAIAALGGVDNIQLTIVPKTGNYQILDRDLGSIFTTDGAVSTVTLTLPITSAGLYYGFILTTGVTLQINVPAGSSIVQPNSPSANISTTDITTTLLYSYIQLTAINSTTWLATIVSGTWSI